MSLTPAKNVSAVSVSTTLTRDYLRDFRKKSNDPNGILRGQGDTNSWKKLKSKILCQTPFKRTNVSPLTKARPRETREGWPLLNVKTGESKSTNEMGPSLVGLVVPVQEIFCSALAALVGPVQNIFFLHRTLFHFFCPHRTVSWARQPGRQPCWVACLLVRVSGQAVPTSKEDTSSQKWRSKSLTVSANSTKIKFCCTLTF